MTDIHYSEAPEVQLSTRRDTKSAMRHGLAHKCPSCGTGKLYTAFLKITDTCPDCGEELHHHRADDAPPYFTMLIVGHVLVAGVLALEKGFAPPNWVHYTVWGPLTIILSFLILPRIKGALVGLQWALRMHGFDTDNREVDDGGLRPHDDC